MFFKRQGLESSFIPSPCSPESTPEQGSRTLGDSHRQRALAMMAMAVAVASPLNPMLHSAWAADAPPADTRPQLDAQPAPPAQPTAQPDANAQPPVQLDTQADQQMSDPDKLREGLKRYKDKQYEESQSILQQVNADNLNDKEKKELTDTLSKTEAAANERRAARAAFEQGEQALQNNQPADAIKLYKQAADNKYVDDGTRQKAKEEITLAEAAQKKIEGNLRQTYDDAKADFKAGRYADARTKFDVLNNSGFKAPLFQKSPADYLKEIDKRAPKTEMANTPAPAEAAAPTSQPAPAEATAAAPAPAPGPAPAAVATTAPAEAVSAAPEAAPAAPSGPSEADRKATAKSAYKLARDQYRKGDWIAARQNFNIAQDNGYKPGLFEDSPAKYLARMDAKESADAAKAKAQADQEAAMAAAAPAPTTMAAVPTDNTATAAAPTTAAPSTAAPAQTTMAAAPATAPTASNPQAELQDTAQMEKVKSQQNAFEAKQLVARGQAAQDKNNYEQALDNYTRAADLDPTNQQAIAGREKMLQLLGRQPGREDQLTRVQKEIEIRRQEIMYRVDQALEEAGNDVRSNDYTAAQAAVDRARVALNTDRTIFTPDELQRMETRIANAQTDVTSKSQTFAQQQAVQNQKQANAAEAERIHIQEETKRRQIASLISRSRSAVNEGKYDEALGIIDQILILDPQNDYAVGVRGLVEDRALFLQQRKYHEDFDRQITVQLNANEERKIPYSDILRFPDNWPDLSATRDESVRRERGEESEDADVQRQLDRTLPEVNFNQVAFGDVIDFLRDITTANIFVNWRALEAAGVDKNAPVTARLRNVKFSKALSLILADVSAQATAKLGYTTGDGVITISTDEEIGKNTTQLVYDISDLLFSPPDPTDIPQFNIQATAQTSGKGGGGGSSGQGLFGGGGGGQTTTGDESRRASEEAREDMIKLIQEAIAPESWKENGGIGSIRVQSGTGRLIVSQTAENQRAIARLLDKLREGLAIQIMVETRFLTVQRNFLEDVGIDFDFTFNNANPSDPNRKWGPISVAQNSFNFTGASSVDTGLPGNLSGAVAESPALTTAISFVDDFTVNALIRATQAEQTSTQVQAPRIMVYNGKTAYVVVSTQRAYVSDLTPVVGQNAIGFDPTISVVDSGVSLIVTATASADRKYVTMNLKPRLQRLLNLVPFVFGSNTIIPNSTVDLTTQPISAGEGVVQQPELSVTFLETTVSVPDGATLLLGGQTLTGELSREEGVPVLSKIPFLKRLFTNRTMSRDDVVLLILVKPTIVIEREQEAKQFPLLTSNKGPG